jgi:hypothetical protein
MSTRHIGFSKGPNVNVPVDQLGPPGTPGQIHWLAQFPDDPRSDDARLNDTSQREFKIGALLSKAPTPSDQISAGFTEADGGSYFVLPEAAVQVKIETHAGSVTIKANSRHELSLIEFTCLATNAWQARHNFLQVAMRFVDYACYAAHSPLFIAQIRVEDVKNQCTVSFFTNPYRKQMVPSADKLYVEMGPIYAAYREAINSNSDFYKFLCYYKILEGLLGQSRVNVISRAKSMGLNLKIPKQAVPDFPDLPLDQRGYVGKPLGQFFSQVLRARYRRAVAHFRTEEGMVLHMGEPAEIERYSRIILLCELCVRKAIGDHEALLKAVLG